MAIFGNDVARRTQSISIQATGRVTTICQHDCSRTIPGFHLAVKEFIERTHIWIEVIDGLPGRRHQDAHALQYIHTTRAQDFEHVIKSGRVRTDQRYQRIKIGNIVELVRDKILCTRNRPVAVALNRIDLAVMRKESKRLREPPLRRRIRRKTLMKYAHRRFNARVSQIRIEIGQHAGHDHALVANRDRRQAHDVSVAISNLFLDTAPRKKQTAIEGSSWHALWCIDIDLLNSRH